MEFSFTEEQRMFNGQVIRFAQKEIVPRAQENDLKAEFDLQSFRRLGEFGILGLHLPENLGGGGADVVTATMVGEALGEAGVDMGLMLSCGAHTFLCADTILAHGTDAQRKKYIPRLATGEWIGCMGLTEPGAGSDAAAILTRAERRNGHYILNGTKMFITNGPVADVAVIYARAARDARHGGISAFIVEKGSPGFFAEKSIMKMGVRTSLTSALVLEGCEVPEENLLGKEGAGFEMALQTVEWDRSALLSPSLGGMTYVLNKCVRYAKERRQFGRPISEFPAIKHKLAEIKIFIEAARSLVYRIAWCKDQGRALNQLEAAVAKLFFGDWSLGPTNAAMTLHGGYGYCHEYEVERYFRDNRLTPIGGGTSEIQKMIISKLL
jgi:butyryl-CoA dehydrogenase